MNRILMRLQIRVINKRHVAGKALLGTIMDRVHMSGQGRLVIKVLLAVRTLVAILTRMMEHVALQLAVLYERNATLLALVVLVSGVDL